MKKALEKYQRLEIFLRYLRIKHPVFKKPKEAHRFLSSLLVHIEMKYCRSIDYMFLLPFDCFVFNTERKVYYLETHKHIIFINQHGSLGIFNLHPSPDIINSVLWDMYTSSHALTLSLSPQDTQLW